MRKNHQIPALMPYFVLVIEKNKKKKICLLVDCPIQADHCVKIKEHEKKDKYLKLAREFNMLWNMKGVLIPM